MPSKSNFLLHITKVVIDFQKSTMMQKILSAADGAIFLLTKETLINRNKKRQGNSIVC